MIRKPNCSAVHRTQTHQIFQSNDPWLRQKVRQGLIIRTVKLPLKGVVWLSVGCWSVLQNLLLDQLRLRFAAVINQCARSSLVRRHKKCGVCTLDFFLQFLFQVYPVWLKAVKNESKPENLTSKLDVKLT